MTTSKGDTLGDRMKRYETVPRTFLTRRTPVIIRIDGKAFHTYTKCLKTLDPTTKDLPFSVIMHDAMTYTTQILVSKIQNCVFGYTQSDEISLLLRDYDEHETEAWFDFNVQKMASISSAIATAAFNLRFSLYRTPQDMSDMALFDSRVYNVPKEEVANYFIWRQQDASRNSVQMLGHHFFSQKQMHGKNNSQVQDMLMLERGINWNDIPTWMKRGSCVIRTPEVGVVIDDGIPVFTQDRDYVGQHVLTPTQRREKEQAEAALLQV